MAAFEQISLIRIHFDVRLVEFSESEGHVAVVIVIVARDEFQSGKLMLLISLVDPLSAAGLCASD